MIWEPEDTLDLRGQVVQKPRGGGKDEQLSRVCVGYAFGRQVTVVDEADEMTHASAGSKHDGA